MGWAGSQEGIQGGPWGTGRLWKGTRPQGPPASIPASCLTPPYTYPHRHTPSYSHPSTYTFNTQDTSHTHPSGPVVPLPHPLPCSSLSRATSQSYLQSPASLFQETSPRNASMSPERSWTQGRGQGLSYVFGRWQNQGHVSSQVKNSFP